MSGRTLLSGDGSAIDIRDVLNKGPSGKLIIDGFALDPQGNRRKIGGNVTRLK